MTFITGLVLFSASYGIQRLISHSQIRIGNLLALTSSNYLPLHGRQ